MTKGMNMVRRGRGRRIERLFGAVDVIGNVFDAIPLLRLAGHVIILPFRIIAHLVP